MSKHIPTWPVAALLIAVPLAITFFSQGVSRGVTFSEIPWCQTNEEQNVWEVHRIENFTETSRTEEGCTYTEHYDGVQDYDDKGVVGTCPRKQACGDIWKLKSVTGGNAQLAAALRYVKSEMEENTFLIGPQDAAKSNWGSFDDLVQTDTELGIEATFEHWIGCQSLDLTAVSPKNSICLDGQVFGIRFDNDLPYAYDMTCMCIGDVIDWEGFSLCIDFDCPDDTAPEDGASICPNIYFEPSIDGDAYQVRGTSAE